MEPRAKTADSLPTIKIAFKVLSVITLICILITAYGYMSYVVEYITNWDTKIGVTFGIFIALTACSLVISGFCMYPLALDTNKRPLTFFKQEIIYYFKLSTVVSVLIYIYWYGFEFLQVVSSKSGVLALSYFFFLFLTMVTVVIALGYSFKVHLDASLQDTNSEGEIQ